MKSLVITVVIISMFVGINYSQPQKRDYGLPELHRIQQITLSPSYSCRLPDDPGRGYEQTALFLSTYSRQRNSFDLLFNGACRSDDKFDVPEMSLISDLGTQINLEDISAHLAFNLKEKAGENSKFERSVMVKEGHTYAVVINDRERLGMFVFTVIHHIQNQKVEIKYAVKSYQIANIAAESPGFEWARKNKQ